MIKLKKEDIEDSLKIIFNEVLKIRDKVYEQIEDRHLDNTSDIWDAITDTELKKYLKDFGIEYLKNVSAEKLLDIYSILDEIEDCITDSIEWLVEKDQWD